ncbi:MAG TPA: hypothetical protein VGT08_09945 [Terracidiphilus sp.]|nr:hypothetical protein [Terracidiphilus sp.]
MNRTFLFPVFSPAPRMIVNTSRRQQFRQVAIACALTGLLAAAAASAQVITVDTSGKGRITADGQIDRRYSQITPTNIPLPQSQLDAKSRMDLIRVLQAEQGFAMRPFPRGHKGLTLVANGKLEPAGEAYLNMVISNGTSAKPGDRLVITDVKFDHSKIIFMLNGGPDAKHRFLRHISIGADPDYTNPVVQDTQDPQGARLTLDFGNRIPALTGAQVKALLTPLISFDVKTPIQAFTDTLPPQLKDAILNHRVMVGMSTDMVLFAKGAPQSKSREMDGQMPFEEWIYGKPPEEVDFVRINGNRVIRVEVAKMGEPPVVFTNDEVSAMLRTDGTPVITAETHTHISRVGDVQRDPNREAPAAPPSLRNPGEQLPTDDASVNHTSGQKNVGVMRPVQFPKKKPEVQPGANPDSVPDPEPATSAPTSSPAPVKTPSPAAGTNQPN